MKDFAYWRAASAGARTARATADRATTARLAAGAAATRDMIVDAWRASADMGVGFPMVNVRDIEAGRRILTRDDFGND